MKNYFRNFRLNKGAIAFFLAVVIVCGNVFATQVYAEDKSIVQDSAEPIAEEEVREAAPTQTEDNSEESNKDNDTAGVEQTVDLPQNEAEVVDNTEASEQPTNEEIKTEENEAATQSPEVEPVKEEEPEQNKGEETTTDGENEAIPSTDLEEKEPLNTEPISCGDIGPSDGNAQGADPSDGNAQGGYSGSPTVLAGSNSKVSIIDFKVSNKESEDKNIIYVAEDKAIIDVTLKDFYIDTTDGKKEVIYKVFAIINDKMTEIETHTGPGTYNGEFKKDPGNYFISNVVLVDETNLAIASYPVNKALCIYNAEKEKAAITATFMDPGVNGADYWFSRKLSDTDPYIKVNSVTSRYIEKIAVCEHSEKKIQKPKVIEYYGTPLVLDRNVPNGDYFKSHTLDSVDKKFYFEPDEGRQKYDVLITFANKEEF